MYVFVCGGGRGAVTYRASFRVWRGGALATPLQYFATPLSFSPLQKKIIKAGKLALVLARLAPSSIKIK